MTYLPVVAVTLPLDLVGGENGKLNSVLLTDVVRHDGAVDQLHHYAAAAWSQLRAAAAVAGITLSFTDCYRPYDQQRSLFLQRYTTSYREGASRKMWNGTTYYKRAGMATAAVPGRSNHGLGIAVDAAEVVNGALIALTSHTLEWLGDWAPRFGWSWELIPEEPWHLHYYAGTAPEGGTVQTADASDPEPLHPPQLPSPAPSEEDDPMKILVPVVNGQECWARFSVQGSTVEWLDGARTSVFTYLGASLARVDFTFLRQFTIVGPVPEGDAIHQWVATDFARVVS